MKWEQKEKVEKNDETPNRQSEEISDIVDRMPTTFGRWVAIVVILFFLLFLIFGWIIKYPDTVSGQITISSDSAPVKLVANSSGRLQLLSFKPQEDVKEGAYIAVITNSCSTKDIQNISMLIQQFNPYSYSLDTENLFPEKVSLGELNLKYYTFLSALKNKYDYYEDNVFNKRIININDGIFWKKNILEENKELLKTSQEKLQISEKWTEKIISLGKVTSEYEIDKYKSEYLAIRSEEQSLKKENISIQMQISESQHNLSHLKIEQKEKERALQLDLLSSFNDLSDNIKAWEEKYVFKAPLDGKIEYLKFLKENQFVQAGEGLLAVVPEEKEILGQVVVPSNGVGKVEIGCRVSIKLDNYPYLEYGTIDGYVSSISLVSQTQQTSQNTIETYLINVDLPDRLKTNYGKVLNYKHEIVGIADIIVKERRLIERLFDNLRYSTK